MLPWYARAASRGQYKDHPLEVPTGGKVRVFVLNAGPNIDSSFHVVGTIFNTVIKEGVRLDAGNEGNYGAQAVDLAPAQGAIGERQIRHSEAPRFHIG
jgi:nitrite reductase (NO-forming)